MSHGRVLSSAAEDGREHGVGVRLDHLGGWGVDAIELII
jgi:hypothetical protein